MKLVVEIDLDEYEEHMDGALSPVSLMRIMEQALDIFIHETETFQKLRANGFIPCDLIFSDHVIGNVRIQQEEPHGQP